VDEMNIIIPIAGPNSVIKDSLNNVYCKPLLNIMEKPLIEFIYNNIKAGLGEGNRYIFIVNDSDCTAFYLDSVINMLDQKAIVVKARGTTKGALCSCMLAIGQLDMDDELLIVNGDQYMEASYGDMVKWMRQKGSDGSLVVFDSIHPKWSYAKMDGEGNVIETAEKKPISRNASVGVYYFKSASDFIEAAKNVIKKDANVNGSYYVSSTYNEMILKNKKISAFKIPNDVFFALDTPESIDAFVRHTRERLVK
jgi:dTDP-glucose pyrophosphorylase